LKVYRRKRIGFLAHQNLFSDKGKSILIIRNKFA
jgi:hypothetical protein